MTWMIVLTTFAFGWFVLSAITAVHSSEPRSQEPVFALLVFTTMFFFTAAWIIATRLALLR